MGDDDEAGAIDAQRVLDNLTEAVLLTDGNGRVCYANPAAERMLGRHVGDLIECAATELLRLRDGRTGDPLPNPVTAALEGPPWSHASKAELDPELVLADRQEPMPVHLSANAIMAEGDAPSGVIVTLRNETNARALRQALVDSAAQDPLMRLVNRAEFAQRVERVLGASGGPHALLFLDLDRFREINDRWGHAAGDYALREITRLFADMIRTRDTFARLGGDEFGLLLEHCSPSVAEQIASSFHATLVSRPLSWRDQPFPLDISIGGTLIHAEDSRDVEVLIESARAACELAKSDDARPVHFDA